MRMTIHLYASTIRLFRYKNIGSNRHKEWRLEMFLPIIANITFVIILRYCSSIWIMILVRIPYAQTRNWWHPWIVPDSMFTSESNANMSLFAPGSREAKVEELDDESRVERLQCAFVRLCPISPMLNVGVTGEWQSVSLSTRCTILLWE